MNTNSEFKVLVLGASGMIGSEIMKTLHNSNDFNTIGTIRCSSLKKIHLKNMQIIDGIDVQHESSWVKCLLEQRPQAVINCIGVTKHVDQIKDNGLTININSIFPHKLNLLCKKISARLIHISSDCVFAGKSGNYSEEDIPDSRELYGLSKKLGEICLSDNLTIRTSTIGHEVLTKNGLLEWFLSQEGTCEGYKNAIFSGVSTKELASVIKNKILPNKNLKGLYNLSAESISKYDLLKLISKFYKKEIEIQPNTSFVIDRSLDCTKLELEAGYKPKDWNSMVKSMMLSEMENKVV
jgi:dTDP-4-dehydrorhamnose reductase